MLNFIFILFFLSSIKETKNEQTHYDEGSEVLSLCALKNGNLAVSYSNNRLNLIDPWTGQTKSSTKLKNDVNYLATSKSDKLFGMTSKNRIYIWNTSNLFLEKTLEFQTSKLKAFSLLTNDHIALAFYSRLTFLDPFKEKEIKKIGNYAKRNSIVSLSENEIASTNFNHIEIYNLDISKKIKFFRAHDLSISSLVVLNNGDLVSGSYDKSIKVWNAREGVLKKKLNQHYGQVCILAALNDGNLASGSADNTIKIWNTTTGMLITTLCGHSNWVRALAVIDENYLASGSVDKTIKIWNLKTALLERTIYNSNQISNQNFKDFKIPTVLKKTLTYHSDLVRALTILHDGSLVSGSNDGTIKIRSSNDENKITTLENYSPVRCFAVLLNGNLLSGSEDNKIKIWTRSMLVKTIIGHNNWVVSLAVFHNGDFASGSFDKTIKIWSSSGDFIRTLEGHTGDVCALLILPNQNLVSGSGDSTIRIWEKSGKLKKILYGHTSYVKGLALLDNGNLASGSDDKTIKIWDDDYNLKETLHEHTGGVLSLKVLPNGYLVSASGWPDNTVIIHSKFNEKIKLSGHQNGIWDMAILPSGDLVTASFDKTIRIWSSSNNGVTYCPNTRLAEHFQFLRVYSAEKCFHECLKEYKCGAITFDTTNKNGCHFYEKNKFKTGYNKDWVSISRVNITCSLLD